MQSARILQSFGIAPLGRKGVEDLLRVVADAKDKRMPEVARSRAQLRMLKQFDHMINAWHGSNETSKKLDEIPGVGPALATARVAGVADPKAFRPRRDFSTWIGLVPEQRSSRARKSSGAPAIPESRRSLDAGHNSKEIATAKKTLAATARAERITSIGMTSRSCPKKGDGRQRHARGI
jgi:transposase